MATSVRVSPGGGRTWLVTTALVILLGLVEVTVVGVVAHHLVPLPIALIVDVVGVLSLVGVAWAMSSVLWRCHRLDDEEVLLVLGYLGQIRVPRRDIASITLLPALRLHEADQTGPAITGHTLILTAATGLPRVEVRLRAPVIGRRLWQRRPVQAVVVTDPHHGIEPV